MASTTAADWLEEDPAPPKPQASRGSGRSQSALSRRAHQAAKRGDDFEDFRQQEGLHDSHPHLGVARQAYDTGAEERRTSTKPASPAPSSAGGGSIELAHQGAGLLLGLVSYALVINYFRFGWPGVTGWFNAKFRNKVTVGGGSSGAVSLIPPAGANGAPQPPQTGGTAAV